MYLFNICLFVYDFTYVQHEPPLVQPLEAPPDLARPQVMGARSLSCIVAGRPSDIVMTSCSQEPMVKWWLMAIVNSSS